jgi:hypothetical protein
MRAPYAFESSDSLAQFTAWLLHVHITGFGAFLLFDLGGWSGVLAALLLGAFHIAGLRASIRVTDAGVVIVKKWLFIPYKSYRAPEITGVWYGGDWGLEEGAACVVVKLGEEEVCIGTSKNMGELHDALSPWAVSNRTMKGAT